MRTDFLCISVLRVASGPRVKLASCKSALTFLYGFEKISETIFKLKKGHEYMTGITIYNVQEVVTPKAGNSES